MPAPWLLVDDGNHGEGVRAAVARHVGVVTAVDVFGAHRLLGTQKVSGVVVVVGTRTLVLRRFCDELRRARPALPVVAVQIGRRTVDASVATLVREVVRVERVELLTEALAPLLSSEDAEVTWVAPPPPPPPPAAPAPDRPASSAPSSLATPMPALAPARPSSRAQPSVRAADDNGHGEESDASGGVEATLTDVVNVRTGAAEQEGPRESLDDAGAALLLRLAIGRRSGRLILTDDGCEGALRFFGGLPVAFEPVTGDAGLYRALRERGLLDAGRPPPILPEGRLIPALLRSGDLPHGRWAGVARDLIVACGVDVASRERVKAVFVPSTTTAPEHAVSVNVLEIIVEARRRLAARDEAAANAFVALAHGRAAATALWPAAVHLLTPLFGGHDPAHLLTRASASELLDALKADAVGLGVLLAALRDAGLVVLHGAPPAPAAPRPSAVTLRSKTNAGLTPRQLLGIGLAAGEDEVEAAYARCVAQIDDELARAPTPEAREALRLARDRYVVARQAVLLQLGADSRGPGNQNPF